MRREFLPFKHYVTVNKTMQQLYFDRNCDGSIGTGNVWFYSYGHCRLFCRKYPINLTKWCYNTIRLVNSAYTFLLFKNS